MTLEKKFFSIDSLILIGIALTGGIALFIVTSPWGISSFPDSANYIGGARNILKGLGFRHFSSLEPLTQWPPWYSFSLAAVGLLGLDPMEGARILHVVLFSLNILLVGVILRTITQSKACALIGAWLMMTSFTLFRIHGIVCSEPWFILLTLGNIYCLVQYLGSGRLRLLVSAAVLTALACLDRYVGITVIAAGAMALLLLHSKKLSCRIYDAFLYLFLSGVPLGLWLVRNRLLAEDMVNRKIQSPSFNPQYYLEAATTFSRWILPGKFPPSLRYAVFIAFVILLITMMVAVISHIAKNDGLKAFNRDPVLRLTGALVLFMGCYLGLHFIHLTFVRASAAANDRHFSPLYVSLWIIFLALLSRLKRPPVYHMYIKWTAILLLGVVAITSGWRLAYALPHWYKLGDQFASRAWKTSPTISAVKALPEGIFIYSNQPAVLYLLTNRTSSRLPRKYSSRRYRDAESAQPLNKFPSRMERVKNKLISKDGYIVYLNERQQWYHVSKKDIEKSMPLVVVRQLPDGTIYKISPGAADG
ncbi:MAG TPA: glycosyltransferase family 39 protein [bacterium]|nr:glycosyltransferase family 39 protein [bacterium]